MKRIYLSLISLLSFVASVQAQQDPHYTQYMYNQSVMNPAYAGSKDALSMGVLYRQQWSGMEGAPKTGTFFGHAPVGNNLGLGLSFINDKLGPVEENNIYADVSYTLELGGEHKLAFGMKAGATLHNVGLNSDVSPFVLHANDPAFAQDINNTYFNLGAGLFYYTEKYYIGASVPNFFKTKHLDYDGRNFGSETSHYFATAGYVFDINENLKLKPHVMVKSAFEAPTSFDGSLNALFFDKLEIGGTYRLDDSFGGMINFRITEGLRIGYAYDHVTSDIRKVAKSSHEFMLLYDLNFFKKASSSPRFF
jgi:type IX secretion system PorP/SprF family membrane protein